MKTLLLALLLELVPLYSWGASTNDTASGSSAETGLHRYRIDPEIFTTNLVKALPPKPGEPYQDLLVRLFRQNGIEFKKPAFVQLDTNRKILIVGATEADHDKIARLFYEKRLIEPKH